MSNNTSNKIKINKTKQTLINQNIAQSKFGMYSQCLTGPCVKNKFMKKKTTSSTPWPSALSQPRNLPV